MSGILAKEKEASSKEESKLKKLFAPIQKFIAKEFLWIVLVSLLAVPIGKVIEYLLLEYAPDLTKIIERFFCNKPLTIITYFIGAVGIYFTRAVAGSISILIKNDKS